MTGQQQVYVSRPQAVLPPYRVARETVLADMVARHPGHPRLASIRRIVGGAQMPAWRSYSQPWDVVAAERTLEERNRTAFEDVAAMGTAAARAVLEAAGVSAGRVDCVVTSHSTGDAVPGLDVHLQQELGLRQDVRRRPVTQLGCGGGAHALGMAVEAVRARPGSMVLVVVAESLSSIYHHGDDRIEHMIFKALWGDSGVAVLVSDRPLGPGLQVVDTWEYLVPASADRYRKRLDGAGVHFDSEKAATDSVGDMAPALRKWLAEDPSGAGRPWPLDFMVAHTGGASILTDLAAGLGIDEGLLGNSFASLDEDGNLGGASVLRVLERTYAAPPAAGESGLLIGFGPGFSVSASRVLWHDGPTRPQAGPRRTGTPGGARCRGRATPERRGG
ncbi:PhlD [Kitasatospora sp. NPDC052868]|uniref:thiolase family protein n=1 Tax=Kitasatospora sp. NPDC052868 TaxID=3364060 RepID=UPI0037C9F86B